MTAVLLSCHAHPSPSLKAWNRRPTRPPSSPLAHPKPLLARPFGVSGKAGSENRLKNHSFPHSVQRATPWNPPRQPDCSRHLYSHSSLCSSSLLLGISLVVDFFVVLQFFLRCSILSFVALGTTLLALTRFGFAADCPYDEVHTAEPITVRPTHSQHRSQITVRPTHSQPLVPFFQQHCPNFSSSVPRTRAFLAFEISSLPSSVTVTTIRTVPCCIDLLPPLRVVLSIASSWDFFPLSHDSFLLCSTLPSCDYHLLPPLQVRLFLSSLSLFLLSLTACRTFGSLHWCIYTLVHTYLRLVLPSLRPLRGLCSSCSRPAISTLLIVLRHLHSSHRLKHLHSSRRLETPPHFSASITNLIVMIISIFSDGVLCCCESLVVSGTLCLLRFWLHEPQWSSRSTAHCLGSIAEYVYCRLRRSHWLSCTSPRSPALRRLLVGE